MDTSPLAQLNSRPQQQPSVISSTDSHSVWNPPQFPRPNLLQRGPFSRATSASFSSFSTTSLSSSSSFTNATSIRTGYFDMTNNNDNNNINHNSRTHSDLLSPMACLTADMSANFNLDPG